MGLFNTILMALEMGSGWFYSVSFVTFIAIMILSENEHQFFSVVFLVGFISLMETAGTFNLLNDPWFLVQCILVYFVAGIFWSFVKWFAYLHIRADELREIRTRFLDKNRATVGAGTVVPNDLHDQFMDYLMAQGYFRYTTADGIIPQIKNHKSRCVSWIIWWPTSLIWTLMSDPMVRIANWMVNRLRGFYQAVANRVFAEFE